MGWLDQVVFWHWWILAGLLLILELTSPAFFFLWIAIAAAAVGLLLLVFPSLALELQLVLFGVLSVVAVIAWRLEGLGMLSATAVFGIDAVLIAVFAFQSHCIWRINAHVFGGAPVPAIHRYRFKQVAILSVAYMVTFGAEVATVSMLPMSRYQPASSISGCTRKVRSIAQSASATQRASSSLRPT